MLVFVLQQSNKYGLIVTIVELTQISNKVKLGEGAMAEVFTSQELHDSKSEVSILGPVIRNGANFHDIIQNYDYSFRRYKLIINELIFPVLS